MAIQKTVKVKFDNDLGTPFWRFLNTVNGYYNLYRKKYDILAMFQMFDKFSS